MLETPQNPQFKQISNCPAISLVILCYKTGHKIHRFLDAVIAVLDSITSNWEIIMVGNYDEGSDDKTPIVVQEIAAKHSRIRAVTKVKLGKMGWDARSGLEVCRGSVIGLIDGDEQMVAEDIAKAYRILMAGQADVVKTYRKTRYDSWVRRVNSCIYNFIYNLLFPGYYINDVNSKPKLFRQSAFEQLQLKSNDWFIDAEIMIQARRYRFKLIEFPTVFYRSIHRKSFVRFSAVFEFLKNLFKARAIEFFIGRNCKKRVRDKTNHAFDLRAATKAD